VRTAIIWFIGAALTAAGCSSPPPTSVGLAPPPPPPPPALDSAGGSPVEVRPDREPYVVPPELQAVVDAPDRTPDDRALDEGRLPAEMLAFFGVREGQVVAELAAGGGYTSELLARAVGKTGKVYGHNTPFILERFAEKPWSERLATPAMKNVVRVDREFEDPLPPEAKDLDGVFVNLFYHDTYWMGIDRAAMNRSVLAALKPGGIYGIIDHSAAKGHGADDTETLHRIEEAALIADVESAGFELVEQSHFLRNPDDDRSWSASPSAAGARRGTSDRFALKFKKP
jgi:predicted methyltransferase